jgi:VanZ family protein
VVPFAVTFGAAIEINQPDVGRGAELLDFVADGVGIGIGLIIGAFLRSVFARWLHGRLSRSGA